jgi:hypothetical protein
MEYEPAAQDVHELMSDFERDFGIPLPFEDASRMLVLYEELCEFFAKYSEGPIPPHLVLER